MILFAWHASTKSLVCFTQHDAKGQPIVATARSVPFALIEAMGCPGTYEDFRRSLPAILAPGEKPGLSLMTKATRSDVAAARAVAHMRAELDQLSRSPARRH